MKMLKKFPSPGVLFARGEGEGVRVLTIYSFSKNKFKIYLKIRKE
jgi:hypothetical protein